MEQLFGARIGARIKQLFDPESGTRKEHESNNFSWPGALGCGCFSRGSLEATVSICTFVSTSHLFGARMVYDFSGPESGTGMEQLFGARIGARIEQLFGARGSWLWLCLQGLFGCHCFNLHICAHQPSYRSPNGIRLFGGGFLFRGIVFQFFGVFFPVCGRVGFVLALLGCWVVLLGSWAVVAFCCLAVGLLGWKFVLQLGSISAAGIHVCNWVKLFLGCWATELLGCCCFWLLGWGCCWAGGLMAVG